MAKKGEKAANIFDIEDYQNLKVTENQNKKMDF